MALVGGVDEAGRGPVIGPLVVAGVAVEEGKLRELAKLAKDSKVLTPIQREKRSIRILSLVDKVSVEIVPPSEIDAWVGKPSRGLNSLEAKVFAKVIEKLGVDIVYVDACDVKPERFARRISEELGGGVKVIAEFKADANHSVVSAASIIAKVVRDGEISTIKSAFGEVGSGYPSDARTLRFLRRCYAREGSFPSCVRTSYKTLKRIIQRCQSQPTKRSGR